jgi:hypothetical protein
VHLQTPITRNQSQKRSEKKEEKAIRTCSDGAKKLKRDGVRSVLIVSSSQIKSAQCRFSEGFMKIAGVSLRTWYGKEEEGDVKKGEEGRSNQNPKGRRRSPDILEAFGRSSWIRWHGRASYGGGGGATGQAM